MKKKIAFLAAGFVAVFGANYTFAQDTIPTLTIDSTLSVGDSATFGSSVRVATTMTIEGQTMMREDATASRDLRVEGNLYVPNMPTLTDRDVADPIFTDADGKIVRGTAAALQRLVYFDACDLFGGVWNNPVWANGPNKIYVKCPEIFVGIGTDSPSHQLTVTGSSKFNSHSWFNSSMSLGADDNTFSKFYIKNTGRDAAIHINNVGTTKQYPKAIFIETNSNAGQIIAVSNPTANYLPFLLNVDGSMVIKGSQNSVFDLAGDGRLIMSYNGVKTFQFNNNGMLRARRVKVDTETWADFVFEKDYTLMPLTEVKAFVEENKHLPNIPSEEQLKNEGLDLADMNKLLMQKVEELTLYLIEQNEGMAALKLQVEALQQKIDASEQAK